jgi:hypothetical protein
LPCWRDYPVEVNRSSGNHNRVHCHLAQCHGQGEASTRGISSLAVGHALGKPFNVVQQHTVLGDAFEFLYFAKPEEKTNGNCFIHGQAFRSINLRGILISCAVHNSKAFPPNRLQIV